MGLVPIRKLLTRVRLLCFSRHACWPLALHVRSWPIYRLRPMMCCPRRWSYQWRGSWMYVHCTAAQRPHSLDAFHYRKLVFSLLYTFSEQRLDLATVIDILRCTLAECNHPAKLVFRTVPSTLRVVDRFGDSRWLKQRIASQFLYKDRIEWAEFDTTVSIHLNSKKFVCSDVEWLFRPLHVRKIILYSLLQICQKGPGRLSSLQYDKNCYVWC